MGHKFTLNSSLRNVTRYRTDIKVIKWAHLIYIATFLLISTNVVATENNLPQRAPSPDDEIQWGIYPEIKLGWRAYKYEADNEKVVDMNFPSLKLSLFSEIDRFYGQGYYEFSLGDGDGNVESMWDGSPGNGENLGPAVNLKRTDWAILFGYRIPHKWEEYGDLGIFAGYKSGNSVLDFNQYFDVDNQQNRKLDYDLSSGGAFLGAGTGIKIGAYGILGVRVAYSWLDIDVTRQTSFSGSNTFSGVGSGVSVGASWIGSLTHKLQYTVGFDWHGYNYEDLKGNNNTQHLDIDESQISVRIGITYFFP